MPPPPDRVRWKWPLWHVDEMLDVTAIKKERGTGGRKPKGDKAADEIQVGEWTPATFVSWFMSETPHPQTVIISKAAARDVTGMPKLSQAKARGLLLLAADEGLAHKHTFKGEQAAFYANRPQAVTEMGARNQNPLHARNDNTAITRTPPYPS